ncbi:MAG: hypothetical protein ACK5WR_09655 [Planctomycetaceae bacterium]
MKTNAVVLVSDAGGKIAPEPYPASNWGEHAKRVLDIVDDQVRNLRKRWLMDEFGNKRMVGTYWGIRSDMSDFELTDTLPAPDSQTLILAETPTRLKALPELHQNRLMNWGYAVCDAAIRRHIATLLPSQTAAPRAYPFPGGVG